jgi:hypothetical protein
MRWSCELTDTALNSYWRPNLLRFCFLPDCKASLQDRLVGDATTGSAQSYDNET